MKVDLSQVQELRNLTGVGIMDCKRTLEEAAGDYNKALALLQEVAAKKAAKKADRVASAGIVDSYIHGEGRIGVLIEVHCETDFLSRSADFRALVRELAMQVAAEAPTYIKSEDVPLSVVQEVEQEAEANALAAGKPSAVIPHIKAGKVRKFCSQVCLLEQRYIKDDEITVSTLLHNFTAKCGERVQVANFVRFQIA